MPFVEDNKREALFSRSIGLDDIPEHEKPSTFKEQLGAAYRLENSLGSMLNQADNLPDGMKATDYDVWENLTDDERLDEQFVANAIYADNQLELDAVRSQRDREMRDKRTLENGGLMATFIASAADPINFIPVGGTAYKTYKTGGSILTNAMATATAAGASTVLTEAELHRTQLTRTFGESAANVTAATLFGGVLGATPGTISKLFSKQQLDEVEMTMNPDQAIAEGGNSVMADRSIGAAKVMQDAQVRGTFARAATKAMAIDPLTRTITSDMPSTRTTVSELAENPLDMDAPLGTSVESAIKTHDGKMFEALEIHGSTYSEYKKAGGKLKNRDFNEEVGKAMRNGSDDPLVQKAADGWRAKLYDPLKKEAIEAKLLPEDVDVATAEEYLNRIWSKEKVAGNMGEFVTTVSKWLDDQQAVKLEKQTDIEPLSSSLKTQTTVSERLKGRTGRAEQKLATVTKQLEDIRRQQKAGIERQVALEDSASKKYMANQRKLDEKARAALSDDYQQYQAGAIQDLEQGKAKAIKELEKEASDTKKGAKRVFQRVAELGGLDREIWAAEGIDPAFFKDKNIKGGFGKPVFPKNGGMSPDDLAEKLSEEGIIPGATANDAVDYIDDFLRGGDDFADPDVRVTLDQISDSIDELSKATDDDIQDIYFGKQQEGPAPAGEFVTPDGIKVDAQGKAIDKAAGRELKVAYTRLAKRAEQLRSQADAYAGKIESMSKAAADADATVAKNLESLEKLVSEFPGKSANAVRAALKARDGVALSKASKALATAIKKIQKADTDVDNEALAAEIAGRIMGTPDGRLPYDYKIGENSAGAVSNNLSGVFQKRSFVIPDKLVEQFLENDIEVLGARYLKNVAPDLELTKKFGDVEMRAEIKRIEQDYIDQIKKTTDPKAARKLNKAKERDIRDIAAMRDRIRGVYGQVDHDNPWVRAGRVARDLNYMRLLGGVVASSIPDVSRVIGAEGIAKTFTQGLVPLVTNIKGFKAAAREAKLYGVGTDALMGGRAEIIADVADYAAGGTAFERGVRSAATKFSSINLMNQWTGGIKQLHAVVAQTRIGDELVSGKYDKRLGQLGISEENAQHIGNQLKRHGNKVDGVWVFNTKAWDNQDLAMMWGAALRKESDRVIIMPGQEKPLFMSSELGKTIGQFKTFMFSATQRILLSNLQRQDKHYIQGMIGLVSVGMMAYVFKNWDAGREISDDPRVWVMEGIDRSGMLGMLMEANNTIEKISGNNYGLRPMIGLNAPASRYASRSALDSLVGPTFGLMGTVIETAGAATGQRDWEASDTRAFRRLLPGQNLSIIRQGLDKIEESVQ
jgi:hypothetical protein